MKHPHDPEEIDRRACEAEDERAPTCQVCGALVREARAAVVAKLEARKLHPEFERLEQKFDPRGPTPPWFVGGGA